MISKIKSYIENSIDNAINFMSSKDNGEERVTHSKSNNVELMINDKEDPVIGQLFKLLFSRYLIRLETSMKDSNLIFDCVNLLQ